MSKLENILFNENNAKTQNILTELEKEVLKRHYYQAQHNIIYIAEELNITPQQVKSLMITAFDKLKKHL